MGRSFCSLLIALSAILAGCTAQNNTLSPSDRTANITDMAKHAGWQRKDLKAGEFILASFSPSQLSESNTLTVYIEGDGLAWQSSYRPSEDPTPINPVALKLALTDNHPAIIYLGRPCQYQAHPNCTSDYWLSKRFAPEVVQGYQDVLNTIKEKNHQLQFVLIGFSGGGAIATLLAEQRNDIKLLVTVAGNLDHQYWTEQHNITPLTGSMNPVDYCGALRNTRQIHFIGENDTIITSETSSKFFNCIGSTDNITIRNIQNFDHHCCWENQWPQLQLEFSY
ncbi:MAG TPA: alpha/beta hydrolase [Pseudomonadales bacterium]|nr:alpha/beta hydrolase [Pseudomonadales bacterium]